MESLFSGVAILVRDHVSFVSNFATTLVALPVKQCGWSSPTPFNVCSAYRPPSAKSTEINHFCNMLTDALVTIPMSSYHVILSGDFNCKHQHWCPSESSCPAGAALYRHVTCFGLDRLVNTSTNTAPACRDPVVVRPSLRQNPQLATDINTTCALGSSDHLTVSCQFDLSPLPGRHLQQTPPKPFPYRYRHVPSHRRDSLNSDLL